MTDNHKNDEKGRTQRCIYFLNQNADHQKLLELMSAAGPRGGSAKLLEMAQVGALFEDQKILKPFLGVAESHGLVKALEMVLLLVKEEQLTTDQKPVASKQVSKKTAPDEPAIKPAQPAAKPQNMGMFSPQTVTLDD